jgi:hypothetical protein
MFAMNSFARTARDFGVNEQSTNREDALLQALLIYGSTDYEDSPLSTNPVRDVTMRLEARGVGKVALDIIKQRLNSLETAFDAGTIR